MAACVACIVSVGARVGAQEFQESYKQYEFGPLATGGISVFMGSIPQGAKTDIQLAYTFGVFGDYSFNKNMGVGLAFGYESRGVYFKKSDATQPNFALHMNYLSIQPSFKFSRFLLGVDIDIPSSASQVSDPGNGLPKTTSDYPSGDLGTIIDVRASALLPLVQNDKGDLDFVIQAGYCVTDALKDKTFLKTKSGMNVTDELTNSPVPTIQLGLTYLFSPGGKVYDTR